MKPATTSRSNESPIELEEETGSSAERIRPDITTRHWIFACLLLLGITWIPLITVHLHRTWLDDDASGSVVVIFPPTSSTRTVFRKVIDADGAIVRPVTWARQVWVVHSVKPGFAGRLRRSGAWGVYSTNLLSANALFSCFHLAPIAAPTH